MDPQVGTSFIPKAALTAQARRSGGIGLLFLLSLALFLFSIVAGGAAFAYTGLLKAQIASKDETLKTAEGAIDSDSIQELVRVDSRLIQGRGLLSNHVSPSAIFELLSQITLERVQYDSFAYVLQPDGSAAISLSGIADSFSSVALQSDEFGSNPKVLRDVVFSNVTVTEGSRINFAVTASVEKPFLLYSRNLTQGAAPAPEMAPE